MSEPCDPTGHPWQTYCSVHDSWRIIGEDCWVARAEKAEAVIQRVRQVLDAEQRRYNPPLGLISRIRNVLDGGDS